jgi:3-dehydroquinate synthetase
MGRDKKNEAGRITLIVLDALGAARVEKSVPMTELRALLSGR